jgi:excisionase family DNA binding protein
MYAVVAGIREVVTTGQAASELGKSRQGVTWLVENKKLRAVKTQAGWLIDPDAVDVYGPR